MGSPRPMRMILESRSTPSASYRTNQALVATRNGPRHCCSVRRRRFTTTAHGYAVRLPKKSLSSAALKNLTRQMPNARIIGDALKSMVGISDPTTLPIEFSQARVTPWPANNS